MPLDPTRPLAVSILRVPFMLEPAYSESPSWFETQRSRMLRSWGGEKGWESQKKRHRLKERAAEAGITEPINLDREVSNTLKGHRLIHFVTRTKGLEAAEKVYDAISQMHFVGGRRLNDIEFLARAAADHAGIPAHETLAFLVGDDGRQEVFAALRACSRLDIRSIPKFVYGGKFLLDGAVHADDHVGLLRDIEKRGEDLTKSVFLEALELSPDVLRGASHPAPATLHAQ